MDVAALETEGKALLSEFREVFQQLPETCPLLQAAECQNGHRFENWLAFLEHVLEHGRPDCGPAGARFSEDVYCLPSKVPESDIEIQSVAPAPTFFGNYAPPDDLDGQIIDLVATSNPSTSRLRLRATPSELSLSRHMASYQEIRAMQTERNDKTTLGSLGLFPQSVTADGHSACSGILPEGGVEDMARKIMESASHKFVLSDHLPIGFNLQIEEQTGADGSWTQRCELFAMSMNMLAFHYISFGFWNTCPTDETRSLWLLASRFLAAADRKTKWLPAQYSTMGRTNVSDEELAAAEDSPLISWERLNRRLWRWIFVVQRQGFKAQSDGHAMASDRVRQGMLAALVMAQADVDRPDLIFLQEVGLRELSKEDFVDSSDSDSFPSATFTRRLADLYPDLGPLLQCYDVVNASPKLDVRRGANSQFIDTGLVLAKRTTLDTFQLRPITRAANEPNAELWNLYLANAGKPIVGVQLLDQNGTPLANLFGAHFEKAKTLLNLSQLFKVASEASSCSVPAMVAGDFNAIVRS